MAEDDRSVAVAEDRAVAPAVGKALEAGIVVLFVGLLTATLYGSVVPHYRTAAGDAVGERVLATAAQEIQQAVPGDARTVRARSSVSLPETIRGQPYEIRVENRSLVLDHPSDALDDRVRLALPETIQSASGNWSSRESTVVVVTGNRSAGLTVRLTSAGEAGESG